MNPDRLKKPWLKLALTIWFIILLLLPNALKAQTISEIIPPLNSPKEISDWLSKNFTYVGEMPDYWQNAQETLDKKTGDCEDFAILAQAILKKLHIPSQILIIKFQGINQLHAICVFKNGEYYSFFSNQELIDTKSSLLKDAITEKYYDWERIVITNSRKETLKVVARNSQKPAQDLEFFVASQN